MPWQTHTKWVDLETGEEIPSKEIKDYYKVRSIKKVTRFEKRNLTIINYLHEARRKPTNGSLF